VDRRIPEPHRTSAYDYDREASKHVPVSLLPNDRRYSCVVPAKPAVRRLFHQLDEHIRQTDLCYHKVHQVSGTLFAPQKKVLYLEDPNLGPAIPHSIFRSIFCEFNNGRIACWSFILPNVARPPALESCLVTTASLERQAGIALWVHINDKPFEASKSKTPSVWW
jgi:hypothetical protein